MAILLFFLTWVAFLISEFIITKFPPWGTRKRRDRISSLIVFGLPAIGLGVLGVSLMFVAPAIAQQPQPSWFHRFVLGSSNIGILNVIGLALAWGAFLIRIAAKRTLGKFYTINVAILRDHQLIQEGIYRYVRHPLYLGILMFYIGLPLIIVSGFGFVIVTIPAIIGSFYRINIEEKALLEKFGDQYRKYAARTARLVPFIW